MMDTVLNMVRVSMMNSGFDAAAEELPERWKGYNERKREALARAWKFYR